VDRKARKVVEMKQFNKAPSPSAGAMIEEEQEPAPTIMSLAFQAAIKDNNGKRSSATLKS
jgi:hypothetical protein